MRWDIPQQIWNSHIILHSLWPYWWSFRLKWGFPLNCMGIQNCRWRHVHRRLPKPKPSLNNTNIKWHVCYLHFYQNFQSQKLYHCQYISKAGGELFSTIVTMFGNIFWQEIANKLKFNIQSQVHTRPSVSTHGTSISKKWTITTNQFFVIPNSLKLNQ